MRSLLVLAVLVSTAPPALGGDPLQAVRAFCQADAAGARLERREWPRVAKWVTWQLEPAWDRIVLIRGYEAGAPRIAGSEISCEVKYTVVGEIAAGKSTAADRVETHTFRLVPDTSGDWWRIAGAPPVPHVSADRVDRAAMADLLDPQGAGYLSASAFVIQLLHGAGWVLPQLDTSALLATTLLRTVSDPAAGDVVLYLDGGRPYHAGVLESEDRVVSMTLNGGLRRAPMDAFAGEVVYRRPVAEAATPAPTGVATQGEQTPVTGDR